MKLIIVVKVKIRFLLCYFYLYKYNSDEQGTPFCCGGPIPEEYSSRYGGYGDDMYDAAESFNTM
jgi:hypothetical protein